MNLTIIAAYSENRVIGYKNDLPWKIPEDLQRFKQRTIDHTVIMGRKTYESILSRLGKPLPKRRNIVMTHNREFHDDRVVYATSLEQAFALCDIEKENFVIGGEKIFELFLPYADALDITRVHGTYKGDAYFPDVNWEDWRQTHIEQKETHTFLTFKRK
jgi:dihydrofolate reductase